MPEIIIMQLAGGYSQDLFLADFVPQLCTFLYTNVPECDMNDVSANYTFCIIKLCVIFETPSAKALLKVYSVLLLEISSRFLYLSAHN